MNIYFIYFIIFLLFGIIIGIFIGRIITKIKFQMVIPKIKQEAINRSRAVLTGQFSEQLSPYLPDFPYSPTEIRFIGKPVDFIVFKGLDRKNIEEVVFLEIKYNKSNLNVNEKSLKNVIISKKVKWKEYNINY